jgi:hypothetical protein
MSMVAAAAPVDAAADPHWFPESFDPLRGEIGLVHTDRDDLATQIFLDHRWKRGARRLRFRPDELRQQGNDPAALAIVWHTGFCCSTLLAKALQSERTISLCEPQILPEIADAGREGVFARKATLRSIPRLAFDLLARPFQPDGAIVLKPAPAANVLLPEAARRPNTRSLFLYSDCRSFLISIAGQKEDGCKYVRRMFLNIVGDRHTQFQWPPAKLFLLSDLEIGALVWHIQIAEFRRALPLLGASVASLDCDALLAQPAAAMEAVTNHFDLVATQRSAEVLARNAKSPAEPYDAETRRARHAEIARQLGPDLDRIVEWSYGVSAGTPRGAPLPNPLLAIGKTYP